MSSYFSYKGTAIKVIKVGIVGGTGYTGVELMRLLVSHPQVQLEVMTSRAYAGSAVADQFPNLRGVVDLRFSEPEVTAYRHCDLIFFATPSATAMHHAKELLSMGVKLIDLAADFRFRDVAAWEQCYEIRHACPELLKNAVYGLPELNREAIQSAHLVGNPGCYPTAVLLALLPLLKNQRIVPDSIIADCKSGISGAGRQASLMTAFCEVAESFKAYGVQGHRHLPEIRAVLQQLQTGADLVFVPHLLPMIRGLHATVYADGVGSTDDIQKLYEQYYQDEPCVDVMPQGSHPETRTVKGANTCRIAVHYLEQSNKYVVLSVIDNLVKGAAGQAVQNMNLMLGLEESTGLSSASIMS